MKRELGRLLVEDGMAPIGRCSSSGEHAKCRPVPRHHHSAARSVRRQLVEGGRGQAPFHDRHERAFGHPTLGRHRDRGARAEGAAGWTSLASQLTRRSAGATAPGAIARFCSTLTRARRPARSMSARPAGGDIILGPAVISQSDTTVLLTPGRPAQSTPTASFTSHQEGQS